MRLGVLISVCPDPCGMATYTGPEIGMERRTFCRAGGVDRRPFAPLLSAPMTTTIILVVGTRMGKAV